MSVAVVSCATIYKVVLLLLMQLLMKHRRLVLRVAIVCKSNIAGPKGTEWDDLSANLRSILWAVWLMAILVVLSPSGWTSTAHGSMELVVGST